MLGNVKHCILATDLALFFPNRARLQDIVDREAFSWGLPDHRLLIEAIAMTGADLCASSKPWEAQRETVRVIFEEFYEQGDFEKRAGRIPIPMMDREKESEQPSSQVSNLIFMHTHHAYFKDKLYLQHNIFIKERIIFNRFESQFMNLGSYHTRVHIL